MATIYGYIVPAMLEPSPNMSGAPLAVRALHNGALAESSRYKYGDIATVDGNGLTTKMTETTASNVTGLLMAGHDWDMKHALIDQRDNSKPILDKLINDYIDPSATFIATFQGNTANTGNHAATGANITAINSGTNYDLIYNSTQGVLTIRSTTASPAVKTLRVFKGEEDDSNIIVAFKFLPDRLKG